MLGASSHVLAAPEGGREVLNPCLINVWGDEAATTIRSRVINEIKELIHQIEDLLYQSHIACRSI
eukprot:236105-Amphidinium_carterae.1